MRLAVVYHQDLDAVLVLAERTGACHLARLRVNGELRLAGNRVSVRSDFFDQRVFHTRLQAFHIVRLGSGYPLLDFVAFGVQDLQRCARQFLVTVGNVGLADLHLRDRILNQDDRVAVRVNGLLSGCGHSAVCRHRERDISCYEIAIRGHGLTQRVFLARLQALDHVVAAVCRGCPLVNHLARAVFNNQLRARDFRTARDVGLLHFNVYGLVVHDQDRLATLVRARRARARYLAGLIDAEHGVARDEISIGSQRLTQRVFHARLQAFDDFRFVAGLPFPHDFAVLVQDLQRRAGQLFVALRDVPLTDGDMRNAVGNGVRPCVCRHLVDNRCLVTRHLNFRYSVPDLSVVVQFGQISPGILPAVFSIQLNSIAIVLAISFQLGHDLRRTFAARIVIVIPDLFNRNICRLQCVCDTGTAHNILEAGYFFFFYCVVNRGLAVLAVLRKFLGSKAPIIVRSGGYSQGINDVFAILDINCDAPGQQFGIVVLQLPDLLAADCRHLRNVCVLDVVAGDDSIKSGRYIFIYCIGDFRRAVFTELRQIPGGEGPLLVTAGGHGQRINDVVAILDVNRDALGHKGLIVALQIPGLLAADVRCLLRVCDLGAGRCSTDFSRCAFICRYKSIIGFFRNSIPDSLRKACGSSLLLISQFQNSYAVLEVHITVLSLHFPVIQCHGNLVLPSVIGIISAHHALADRQVAFLPLVCEGCFLGLGTDCSDVIAMDCVLIAIDDNFRYLIADTRRQSGCFLCFVIVQSERRLVVPEVHVAIAAVLHCLTRQFYGKCEVCIQIRRCTADDRFADFQVTFLALVVKCRCSCKFLCAILVTVVGGFSFIGSDRTHLGLCHNNFRIIRDAVRSINSPVDRYLFLFFSDLVIICTFVFVLDFLECDAGADIFDALFFFPLIVDFFIQCKGEFLIKCVICQSLPVY